MSHDQSQRQVVHALRIDHHNRMHSVAMSGVRLCVSQCQVYTFCIEHRIRMHVVGRFAVPPMPMALSKDYLLRAKGNRAAEAVMSYLVDCQVARTVCPLVMTLERQPPRRGRHE